MSSTRRRGAEEARNQFSDLLAAAEHGDSTIITRRGRPVAALVPIDKEWGLTRRECEVFRLIALGHTNKEIAFRLAVSVETVRSYLSRIFAKTGFTKRADLVAAYSRQVAAAAPGTASRDGQSERQQSLVPLKGTGRGLWGRNSTAKLEELRGEWER
jgi:prevent-host-death family protein